MRVIAGSARRIELKSLPGNDTRPTLDRYKETLFNTIQSYVPDSLFIDVFAGTGSIGIEALSRGAKSAIFIENNRRAVKVINENLEKTHLTDKAYVLTADAVTGLMQSEKHGRADVIYIDPPYNMGLEEVTLRFLRDSALCDEDTLIICEASNDTTFDYLSDLGFMIVKTKDYRTNRHVFITRA